MTTYDWLLLIPGPMLFVPGLRDWRRLSGAAARLALARALFGLGFLLTTTKLPMLLGASGWRMEISMIGLAVAVTGLVVQGRAMESSYRSIAVMLGSIVAMACAMALGLFLVTSLEVTATIGIVAVMAVPIALVGVITVWLLRDDPMLGMPLRFRRTIPES